MSEVDSGSDGKGKTNDSHIGIVSRIFSVGPQGVMQAAGLFFTFAAFFAFIYGMATLIARSDSGPSFFRKDDFWVLLVAENFVSISLIVIGVISALLGMRLFDKAGAITSQVIREAEKQYLWPLISAANRDAINEYIRLASLTGFSGTFTKLGFTGLPLVTVALTLILLVMTMLIPDKDLSTGFFDLAKLTLGAFLGSFVQRNIEQEKLASGSNLVDTGNVVSSPDKVAAEKAARDKVGAERTDAEKPPVDKAAAEKDSRQ